MPDPATLSVREVAELAGAPKRVIEKAIEEGILRAYRYPPRWPQRQTQRLFPAYVVAYAALLMKLDLKLSKTHKKQLISRLAELQPGEMRSARVKLAPAVEVDVGRLVGTSMDRTERYLAMRDAAVVVDEAIMGGTPVIRGTRITVYSLLGRIEHGETIDDILTDNPDLSREAVEAAVTYARTHPLMGRPAARPWTRTA